MKNIQIKLADFESLEMFSIISVTINVFDSL